MVIVEKDGVFNIVGQAFMPSEKVEELTARDGVPYMQYVRQGILTLSGENFVDYKDVYNWMVSLVSDYQIYPLMTGYDRYSAQYLIKDLEQSG